MFLKLQGHVRKAYFRSSCLREDFLSSLHCSKIFFCGFMFCFALMGSAESATQNTSLPFACNSRVSATLNVSSESGFAARLNFPPNSFIVLYITRNITLTKTLTLDASFSCTVMRKFPGISLSLWLSYNNSDMPALAVNGASGLSLTGLSFAIRTGSCNPACNLSNPELSPGGNWTCPAVVLNRAWSVRISQGSIVGRTDIFRSAVVAIDRMILSTNHTFLLDPDCASVGPSVVRVSACGDPANLVRSQISITNNDIAGSSVGVLLMLSAVGVSVSFNRIHDFWFSGIQCGSGLQSGPDCLLSIVNRNLISAPINAGATGNASANGVAAASSESSGIYVDAHWFNPGNVFSCNYVIGAQHCMFLNWTTTGVTVDGLICQRSTDGLKVSTGSKNTFKSAVAANLKSTPAYVSCYGWCDASCSQFPGARFWNEYISRFGSAKWKTQFPFLDGLCTRISPPSLSSSSPSLSTPCVPSPSVPMPSNWSYGFCSDASLWKVDPTTGTTFTANATASGNCSAVPILNSMSVVVVNRTYSPSLGTAMPYCEALPSAYSLNQVMGSISAFKIGEINFNNVAVGDFGVDDLSDQIYQLFPGFRSCPLRSVGPQPLSLSSSPNTLDFSPVLFLSRREAKKSGMKGRSGNGRGGQSISEGHRNSGGGTVRKMPEWVSAPWAKDSFHHVFRVLKAYSSLA